jgi:hypothetical protein
VDSDLQLIPGDVEGGQKWKISCTQYTGYKLYKFETYYYGKDFNLPAVGRDYESSTGIYERNFLYTHKSSRTGIISNGEYNFYSVPYFNSAGVAQDYNITTIQLVDWVYLKLDEGVDAFSGVVGEEYRISKIGDYNPYLLAYYNEWGYMYAVNPRDLYTLSGQPESPFNFTVQGTDTSAAHYIYAPDDIVYPWSKNGLMRTGATSDDPVSCYQESILGDISSHAFVGVKGYKLAGYDVTWEQGSYDQGNYEQKKERFLLNEENGDEVYSAFPCITNGTTDKSIANKLSLDSMVSTDTWEGFIKKPLTLTPLFVQASPITVTLSYEEAPNTFYGSYTAKDYVFDKYWVTFTGVELKSVETFGIELMDKCVDLVNVSKNPYFERLIYKKLENKILYSDGKWYARYESLQYLDYQQMTDEQRNKELSTTEYRYSAQTKTLAVKLSALFSMEFESEEYNIFKEKNMYARGLQVDPEEQPSGYSPARTTVVPDTETMKYSCFVNTSMGNTTISRIFTASDTFTVNNVYGNGTIAGVIMDMSGTDEDTGDNVKSTNSYYGPAFYGGEIDPLWYTYTISQDNIHDVFCVAELMPDGSGGYEVEELTSGTAAAISTKKVTRDVAKDLSNRNIAEFLEIGSNGRFRYAGVFAFRPYQVVTISNASQAYACPVDPVQDPETYEILSFNLYCEEKTVDYEYYTIGYDDPEDSGTFVINLTCESMVYPVPDGYILALNGGGTYLIYYGEKTEINVRGSLNPNNQNYNVTYNIAAEDKKAKDVTFKFGPV